MKTARPRRAPPRKKPIDFNRWAEPVGKLLTIVLVVIEVFVKHW
jgi:hypothetical protein